MKIVIYTAMISPHQLPLARELVKIVGVANFRYVYLKRVDEERVRMGWAETSSESWCRQVCVNDVDLETCEILLSGVRDISLFERRCRKNLKTYYMSERWFKPIAGIIPGWVRLFHPPFLRMALQIRHLIRMSDYFRYLHIGKWARCDMLRICGHASECKMVPWGYFVATSSEKVSLVKQNDLPLRILWAGRMIYLKHVYTLVNAMKRLCKGNGPSANYSLTLIGSGPEQNKLISLADGLPVKFMPFLPLDEVRRQMRLHDVYVFTSDARDGWGAVVSEALEEGMHVLGTKETGASSTLLSSEDLFHATDVASLARMLEHCLRLKRAGNLSGQGIGEWSVVKAAERLMSI